MSNKLFSLTDIYFNEPEIRIKITNIETGEGFVYFLSQKKEIENYFDSFISTKDIHAIGILQGIEFTKIPSDTNKLEISFEKDIKAKYTN
jgi:histidinol phosphatase-like PHP family hydrolase